MTDEKKTRAERLAELRERHSERLIVLAASTHKLREHNDALEAKLEEEKRWGTYIKRIDR